MAKKIAADKMLNYLEEDPERLLKLKQSPNSNPEEEKEKEEKNAENETKSDKNDVIQKFFLIS